MKCKDSFLSNKVYILIALFFILLSFSSCASLNLSNPGQHITRTQVLLLEGAKKGYRTNTEFPDPDNFIDEPLDKWDYHDIRPDRFSYNFMGKSGTFYFNHPASANEGEVVILNQDITNFNCILI